MGNNNPALKRYIRDIRKTLPCSGKMKRDIVSQIRKSIEDYLLQNPAADLEAVQAHFGTPQQIAVNCLDGQDAFVQLKKIRTKKRVLAITAGAMASIILMLASYVAWDTYLSRDEDIHVSQDGDIDVSTCIIIEKIEYK
jgi:hypothetical protein